MLQHIKQFLHLHKYCEGHKEILTKDMATVETTKHEISKISHFVIYVTCYTFQAFKLLTWPTSWSSGQSLTTDHEVPGSIPGSTVGIFPEGEDSHGDHGLGRLAEFRFKGPPGTTSSYIITHIIRTT